MKIRKRNDQNNASEETANKEKAKETTFRKRIPILMIALFLKACQVGLRVLVFRGASARSSSTLTLK